MRLRRRRLPELERIDTRRPMPELVWDRWLAQERERVRLEVAHARRIIRPSIDLPADLVAACDRTAETLGMTRSQYVAAALLHYQAGWRKFPGGTP